MKKAVESLAITEMDNVEDIVFSEDLEIIAILKPSSRIEIFNSGGKLISTFEVDKSTVGKGEKPSGTFENMKSTLGLNSQSVFAISPDGQVLAHKPEGSEELTLWSTDVGAPLVKVFDRSSTKAIFSKDNSKLVTISGVIGSVIDLKSNRLNSNTRVSCEFSVRVDGDSQEICCASFIHRDQKEILIIGCGSSGLSIWNIDEIDEKLQAQTKTDTELRGSKIPPADHASAIAKIEYVPTKNVFLFKFISNYAVHKSQQFGFSLLDDGAKVFKSMEDIGGIPLDGIFLPGTRNVALSWNNGFASLEDTSGSRKSEELDCSENIIQFGIGHDRNLRGFLADGRIATWDISDWL